MDFLIFLHLISETTLKKFFYYYNSLIPSSYLQFSYCHRR